LPQGFAGSNIERAKCPIEIANKADAAGRRQHTGEEGRSMLLAPYLFHVVRIVGDELSNVAVAAGHLEEAARRAGASRAVDFLNIGTLSFHAPMAVRHDQQL